MAVRNNTAVSLAALEAIKAGRKVTRFTHAADLLDPPELAYKNDPVRWLRERGRIEPWSKQREVIQSVRDNTLTAVHSCHSIGKSLIAAATVCWWLDVHPPGSAFVVTTAPTGPQVEAILWREINRIHARAQLKGRTNLTEWYLGKELVAYGRKPAENNPTAFQGIHARYFLVVLDEACGIPKTLWDAASTLAANEHSRTLAIGNPDDAHGEFAENCRPNSGWNVIHVGYWMTPNFTGEKVPQVVRESLISRKWVEDRRKKWGENSAIFTSKCKGEFPLDSEFGVVPYSWATACRVLEVPAGHPVEAGIDVGGGGDRTVIRERRGPVAGREEVFTDPDPMRTVGRLVEIINDWGVERVKIDVIGIGWGVYGRLRELSSKHNLAGVNRDETTHDAEVVPVNFGAGPSERNKKKFLNKRAEVYWLVGRELSRLRGWDLGTLDDDVIAELCAAQYEILDSNGKIKIEKKEDIIQRLGQSPDRSDALLLAFYDASYEATISTHHLDRDVVRTNTGPEPGGYGKRTAIEDVLASRALSGPARTTIMGPMGGGRW